MQLNNWNAPGSTLPSAPWRTAATLLYSRQQLHSRSSPIQWRISCGVIPAGHQLRHQLRHTAIRSTRPSTAPAIPAGQPDATRSAASAQLDCRLSRNIKAIDPGERAEQRECVNRRKRRRSTEPHRFSSASSFKRRFRAEDPGHPSLPVCHQSPLLFYQDPERTLFVAKILSAPFSWPRS